MSVKIIENGSALCVNDEVIFIDHTCEKCGKKCKWEPFNFWSHHGFVCDDCDQELIKKGEIRYV